MPAVAKKQIDPTFGRRLRELRERAGLTLIALGEKAGMQYQSVARLERAEREPTWATIVRLADALGVDLNAFRVTQVSTDEAPADPPARPMGKRK